jgi:hypothetical protein
MGIKEHRQVAPGSCRLRTVEDALACLKKRGGDVVIEGCGNWWWHCSWLAAADKHPGKQEHHCGRPDHGVTSAGGGVSTTSQSAGPPGWRDREPSGQSTSMAS